MTEQSIALPPVLESLNIGITLHDPDTGILLNANDRLEQLFGYPVDELRTDRIGEYATSSVEDASDEAVELIRAAADGEPQELELQIERANGEYRWISIYLSRTSIEGETFVIGQITDVTEYRVREQLLHLLNRVIRHNLRNDMNVLMGYADRIKTAVENDRLEEEIETIRNIATEVGTLSESLDRIEGIVEPNATQREPTDLLSLVRDCVAEARSEYPEAELTIETLFDIDVTADSSLKYAIEHAIENAIVHNDRETPAVTLTVTDDPEDNYGVVRIADNGPTIPDIETDVLDNKTAGSSTYHGSGVGLWVMKWCVDSLGGNLSFSENAPRGNVVEISIPEAGVSSVAP